jgi:hypothetical protein
MLGSNLDRFSVNGCVGNFTISGDKVALKDMKRTILEHQKKLFVKLQQKLEDEKALKELLDINEAINDSLKHYNRVTKWKERSNQEQKNGSKNPKRDSGNQWFSI